MSLSDLHEALQVDSEKVVDAMARRLGAMARDGQIIRNRQNNYIQNTPNSTNSVTRNKVGFT